MQDCYICMCSQFWVCSALEWPQQSEMLLDWHKAVVFMCVCSFEDVQCLGDSSSLSEICLDGNPIAQDPNYKQIVLRNMQQLKQLDMRRVTVRHFYSTLPLSLKLACSCLGGQGWGLGGGGRGGDCVFMCSCIRRKTVACTKSHPPLPKNVHCAETASVHLGWRMFIVLRQFCLGLVLSELVLFLWFYWRLSLLPFLFFISSPPPPPPPPTPDCHSCLVVKSQLPFYSIPPFLFIALDLKLKKLDAFMFVHLL